jgi:hypothetical protein
MKFSPPSFRRVSVVLALAALPLLAGIASAGPSPAPGKQAPVNSSPPTVSGTAVVGSTLVADGGTWSGPGVKLSCQWQRCDALGNGCANVPGATGTTLLLTSADVGYRLRAQVTGTNKNGQATATSSLSEVVAPVPSAAPSTLSPPAVMTPPSVGGVPSLGQVLGADPGSWSGTQPIAYAYQWQRCESTGGNCTTISGATTDAYQLSSADVGAAVRVSVTASNAGGSAAAASAATAPVASSTSSTASGCSSSNPSACPPSFFNGPLGASNLIPSKPGAFLIQWFDGIGCDTACKQAGIQKRQADSGRIMDGVGLMANFGDTSTGCTLRHPGEMAYPSWINSNGSFPVITWTPNNVTIGDINRGAADTCLRNVASFLKTYPFRIMLRPFHEFDGNWTRWSAMPGPLNGNVNYCGQPFIDAWRRVVNTFKGQGATNVGFFWNPGEGGVDRSCSVASYPGDAYVDWVGTEVYNFCFVGESTCMVTPLHSGWAEWWELPNYTTLATWQCASEPVGAPYCVSQYDKFSSGRGIAGYTRRKPMVIGESGTVYDARNPSRKGAWYANIPAALKGQVGPAPMPNLIGIQMYDADVSAVEGPRNNFRVDYPTSDPSAYGGWIQLARDPYFNTR